MKIVGANKNFDIAVGLVGSKSESNRALMICHYGGFKPRIRNLSESDDTKLLYTILQSLSEETMCTSSLRDDIIIDCRNAGTVLRFLATALSVGTCHGASLREWILTGSPRMQQRPVGDLVDALRRMGADIRYLGQEGFPPLKIHGFVETHGRASLHQRPIHVDITHSSQFASSLLLAIPIVETDDNPSCRFLETDFHPSLRLDGDLSSLPYIDMTIDVMRKYGVDVRRDGRDVIVQPSEYQDVEYTVESDWTCASYWYEIVAFSENGRVRLHNLHLDSKQGDAIVAKWFENFGVQSIQDGNDVVITRVETDENPSPAKMRDCTFLQYDFTNNPDLYPTIAATCAGLGIKDDFTGLQNLKFKESDRVAAMTTELLKINSVQTCHGASLPIKFDSHDDHRIAMALAPLAMKIGAIEINNADVVSKSYPGFWTEFSQLL